MKIATASSGGFGSLEFAMKYEGIDHEVVFAIEWMDAQRKSYIQNHCEPESEFAKDICDFYGAKYKGQIDLYHLSPPCQSYSMAGKREGAESDKGQLMFEAIKSIAEVQPKMFTIENVKCLLSANGGDDFRNIMRDLRKHITNYTIQYGVLNAKEMGTPQNRERVFIVGFRANVPYMPFPQKVPLQKTLKDILDDDVPEKYYLSQKMLDGFVLHKERHEKKGNGFGFAPISSNTKSAKSISTKSGSRATDNYLPQQIGSIDKTNQNRQATRVYDTQIASTQSAGGGGHGAKTGLYAVKYLQRDISTKKHNVKAGEYIHTLTTDLHNAHNGGNGAKIAVVDSIKDVGVIEIDGDKFNVRRLTPREAARCFGDFDDKFITDGFSDTKLYEFIGNAIDINTMRRLVVKMIDHIDGRKLNDVEDVKFEKRKVQCSLFS